MIHGRLSLMLGARPVLDSVTPSCEGRPPAFQASRATRATKSAVASAAWLEGPAARYPICGRAERPAFPPPLPGHCALDFRGEGFCRTRARERRGIALGCRGCDFVASLAMME